MSWGFGPQPAMFHHVEGEQGPMTSSGVVTETARASSLRILLTVSLTFLGYLNIGLPLAVLPTHVAGVLGFGPVLAGLTVSTQYIATILSRAQVGRMSDLYGPKRAVLLGFAGCVLSGLFTLAAAGVHDGPVLALCLLLAGRLALGIAESWIGTGAITWAIGQVGPEHTVRIISWNGIATYGALAVGAPLGVSMSHALGFWSIGCCTCLLGAVGLRQCRKLRLRSQG